MATSAEEWLKSFQKAETDLSRTLARKDNTFVESDAHLAHLRTAFEKLFFASLDLATSEHAETALWNAHSKLNGRYRKHLAKFRDEEGKKKPVEKRKAEKHYMDFIKTSMRFYRGFIQLLASHHQGIPELSSVATKMHLEAITTNTVVQPSPERNRLINESCHATLVRLGDLSRYRETELKTKERNWGPATGYYELAIYVKPSSGLPHNQLAVIALAEGQHVRALYRLYRAQAVEHPHSLAKGNLELEFKKIIQRKAKNELFPRGGPAVPERTVDAWFVYLHAQNDKGEELPEHELMESEFLSQLSVLLKEGSLENQLQRYTIVNIAAEYIARKRAEATSSKPDFLLSFQLYERLNLRTFFTLLQLLSAEIAHEGGAEGELDSNVRLSTIARRILPSLRHYSSWLITNASFLVAQEQDPLLGIYVKEFWKIYTSTLMLLWNAFPVRGLPFVEYLLDEDEDTIGFLPLANENTMRRYDPDGDGLKARPGQDGVPRVLPNAEMLFRIRELMADGVELATRRDAIPIEFTDDGFFHQEQGLPRETHSSPPSQSMHTHTRSSVSIKREDIERAKLARNRRDDDRSTTAPSVSNNTMRDMVDDLVGSEMDENASHAGLASDEHYSAPGDPAAVHTPSAAGKVTAQDLVKSMIRPSTATTQEREETIRPLSSSIWTPLPGEAGSPQTRPGTASRVFDPTMTPMAQPTSSFFNDELKRQHQNLVTHPGSSGSPGTPSSWLGQENTPFRAYRPISQGSPWSQPEPPMAASPLVNSSNQTAVPRSNAPVGPRFGAIGQTPPSAQGG